MFLIAPAPMSYKQKYFSFQHPVEWVYLGEAAAVVSHDVRVGTFQFLDDLKALVELSEDVHHRAGEQSVLRRLLELQVEGRQGKLQNFRLPVLSSLIITAKSLSIFSLLQYFQDVLFLLTDSYILSTFLRLLFLAVLL